MHKKIAILGGGAAGMMVAATLVERNSSAQIIIFEKNNELGTKVRISGGGRCNVTTGYFKKQDLQKKYTRGRDFLAYAMGQFGPRKMYTRCESHGVPLKCEEDMRIFPQSNNGKDIVSMFEKIIHTGGAKIYFQEEVLFLQKSVSEGYTIITNKGTYDVDYVVITTGGNAYAHTGSSGDGYNLVKTLGHTVTQLGPSLNSFLVEEQRIKECSGISFSHAKIHSTTSDKVVLGPILCTHFGISGPATFTYSSHIPYTPISGHEPHSISIIPYADRTQEWWLTWFYNHAKEYSKKQLSTILGFEFTKRRVELFLSHYNIDGSIMISNISTDQRKYIAKLLGEGFSITLTARRPGDEFVTAGGVNTDEVNSKTMESKICPGLYFAGEILNIDAVTGGFNFQSCRATARSVGNNIIL